MINQKTISDGAIYASASKKQISSSLDLVEIAVLKQENNELKARIVSIESIIHYPDCWDTATYPTLDDALRETFHCNDHVEIGDTSEGVGE